MPRQPQTPPFYSTYNYRESSNDWAGNLPAPVAESKCKSWTVEMKLTEPGKFKSFWTPVWEEYFKSHISIIEVQEVDNSYKVKFDIDHNLYRMDHTDIQEDLSEYLYNEGLKEIGDDPEFSSRECYFDFNKKHETVTLNFD